MGHVVPHLECGTISVFVLLSFDGASFCSSDSVFLRHQMHCLEESTGRVVKPLGVWTKRNFSVSITYFSFANYSMRMRARARSVIMWCATTSESPQVLQRGRDDGRRRRRRWQGTHGHKYPSGCRLYGWRPKKRKKKKSVWVSKRWHCKADSFSQSVTHSSINSLRSLK